ncbi:MAG: DUF4271 domain-containing protein [Bacteroidales bacterium]|nr:DUF4271 domain-containing protein [Bacteroidales bacterium]
MATQPNHQFLQDTVYVPQRPDTISSLESAGNETVIPSADSANGMLLPQPVRPDVQQTIATTPVIQLKEAVETHVVLKEEPVSDTWNTGRNFLQDNGLSGIVKGLSNHRTETFANASVQPPEIQLQKRIPATHDWLLGIFLLLVVLFVWIRIFYSKFFATLGNALVSFHMSAKLLEEKNVLSQRVSTVLDFIYLIVFSVFLYELIDFKGLSISGASGIRFFLILFNLVILYALFRIIMLKFTGFLFLSRSLFSEYLHSTFVVNKGLGIVLFPVVVMTHYLPNPLMPVLLIMGVAAFLLAFLWKLVRAYQIIIRRDILIFYLILYLCTLEILPFLLGYKFVIALIQSN